MHEVLQLLMWYFLPVIWLLNLIVACHHFLAACIYMVCCYIYCCWCLLGEGCCSPLLPTGPHCGGSASERDQEGPQEQHKVENRETFRNGQDTIACPILCTWDSVTTCTPVTIFIILGVQLCYRCIR